MPMRRLYASNARYHIIEGALYISTGAFLSPQTIMPALIRRLGGSDVLIGTWPVVVYLVFSLPQIVSANVSSRMKFRKPFVIAGGFVQRLHILALAAAVALWGVSFPVLALVCMFLLYSMNQAASGSVSPVWMDFLTKTVAAEGRGRLMGWRISIAAVLAFANGLILTFLFTVFRFPFEYATVFFLAFLLQMGSLWAQQQVVEPNPSPVSDPVRLAGLLSRVKGLLDRDPVFRKFLAGSSLMTLSFSAVAFFTVAALKRLNASDEIVGLFTIISIAGQIFSGVVLGWIADTRGTKTALLLCEIALLVSIVLALWSTSILSFSCVFACMGMNIGAETFMRYNFAVDCAPESERPMYIGTMNVLVSPFYAVTPLAGWVSAVYGYNAVFWMALPAGIAGLFILMRTPAPRRAKLALSSK